MATKLSLEDLELLREWIQAEIAAGIADSTPDESGYIGTGYSENRVAKELFEQVKAKLVKED